MKKILATLTVALWLVGCGDLFPEDKKDNNTPPPPPTKLEDSSETIGIAIANLMVDLNNVNIAGKTCGEHEITTLCPNGGTVLITGKNTCGESNGSRTSTNEFTFTMADCSGTHNDSTVTITGVVLSTGSVTDISGIVVSQSLQYAAIVKVNLVASGTYIEDFDENCRFAVMLRKGKYDAEVTTSGNVDGKTF